MITLLLTSSYFIYIKKLTRQSIHDQADKHCKDHSFKVDDWVCDKCHISVIFHIKIQTPLNIY